MKNCLLFLISLGLLTGCNRNDKSSDWEKKYPKPIQDSFSSDPTAQPGPATQASGDPLPKGHPPVDTPAAESSDALPKGHPPVTEVADSNTTNPSDAGAAEASKVELNDMHWTASKDWVRKQPASPIIQVEFKLPGAKVDTSKLDQAEAEKLKAENADGRLTISAAGGSLDANIARWRGQFGGKPEKDKTEQMEVSGLKITLVDLEGTFKDGGGPMFGGASVDRPGYRMLGAVIPRGDTNIFIKAYGPAKTMAARADEVKAFLKSMKVEK